MSTPSGGIRLTPIPRLAQGGRWRVEAMRSYSSDVLLWFTRGQGRITVSGNTRGYGAHNAIYIPAGTMHGFSMNTSGYGIAVFLHPNLKLGMPDRHLHLRVRDAMPQAELNNILDNLQRELESNAPESNRAALFHAGLLSVWLTRTAASTASDMIIRDKSTKILARYTELVEQGYKTGRGIGDYASALGITPTHLTRICKQSCGKSASGLLSDRLMFEARKLLKDTQLPVQNVSEQLGFKSAAYFSRVFHNQTGMTPSAFRKGR